MINIKLTYSDNTTETMRCDKANFSQAIKFVPRVRSRAKSKKKLVGLEMTVEKDNHHPEGCTKDPE